MLSCPPKPPRFSPPIMTASSVRNRLLLPHQLAARAHVAGIGHGLDVPETTSELAQESGEAAVLRGLLAPRLELQIGPELSAFHRAFSAEKLTPRTSTGCLPSRCRVHAEFSLSPRQASTLTNVLLAELGVRANGLAAHALEVLTGIHVGIGYVRA